jgi:hypothetical protein
MNERTGIPSGYGTSGGENAGDLGSRIFGASAHPFREIENEGRRLHEIEQAGESGATPLIAVLGLIPFLVAIFAVILGLALAAQYLAS